MTEIPTEYDTVIVGTIEQAGVGGTGGFHHRWFLRIHVDEQLRGPRLPHSVIMLYIHSPVQEFPGLITTSPHEPGYTAPLVGTRWTWALEIAGTTIESFRRYPPPP